MLKDYFNFAIRSLTRRKLRSWLTILGIVIGIAAVVSLISIGQGMEEAITDQFEEMGTNKIMVMAGGESTMMSMMSDVTNKLTEKDLDVVERVGGVDMAAPFLVKTAAVEFKDEMKYTTINAMGIDDTMDVIQEASSFEVERGRMLKDTDTYKALVGYTFANDFFDDEVRARNTIIINGVEFRVVGILKRIGNSQDDNSVTINIDIARDIFDEPEEVTMIFAEVKPGLEPADVAEDVEKALRRSRNEEKGKETFYVTTMEDLISSFTEILGVIQLVLIGIAGISLFVGGVGIMNTMYTSVTERTKEIGVMKAIGAKNHDVLLLFLVESGLVGLLGGGVGCALGALMAKGVEIAGSQAGIPILKAAITPELFLSVLSFSFFLGIISGILPARRASKLAPVDALRHE